MAHYLKYLTGWTIFLIVAASMFAGGHWMWFGFIFVMIAWAIGDLFEDRSEPELKQTWFLDGLLYSGIVMLPLLLFVICWITNSRDLFGVGQWIHSITSYDVLAARETNAWFDYIGAGLGAGIVFANAGILGAHELIHRTWDPIAQFIGRWEFSLSGGGYSFESSHLRIHHPLTGNPDEDPASARRGENVYHFLLRGSTGQLIDAWKVEAKYCASKNKSAFSLQNRVFVGILQVLSVVVVLYLVSGWAGVGVFYVGVIFAKLFLEAVTYHAHLGQFRVSGTESDLRHTWDNFAAFSTYAMYAINRHSSHHTDPTCPYYQLPTTCEEDVPQSTSWFYLALLAYIPWLYHKYMIPKLLEWDEKYATPDEAFEACKLNANSRIPRLREAAKHGPCAQLN